MSDVSKSEKYLSKERVTATPNNDLIERAKKATLRLGISSQGKLADLAGVGRSTVSKFFNQKPILLDRFNLICKTLNLLDYELATLEIEEEGRKGINTKANDEIIERAENAMRQLNISSKNQLAITTELSRTTINRFFQKEPIRLDNYNQICETLLLNEKTVKAEKAEIEIKEADKVDFTITGTLDKEFIEKLKSVIEALRKLTAGDLYFAYSSIKEEQEEDIGEEKVDFTIIGTIDKEFIGKLKSVIEVLRQLTDGDIYCYGTEIG